MFVFIFITSILLATSYGETPANISSIEKNNKTESNITLSIEGGPAIISPINSAQLEPLLSSFPKENSNPKKSHVRGRPEPYNRTDFENDPKDNDSNLLEDDTINRTIMKDIKITNLTNATSHFQKINATVPTKINSTKSTLKTAPVKKPLVLSADKLIAMDDNIKPPAIAPKTSVLPEVSNQILPPSSESDMKMNIHVQSDSQTPGMVIPIVITILVVPAFAVLGYMALKHGQEAWKNRHYKRMDFLLDGMYND